ncbi:hypothetical protein PLESTB_000433300 [Pleodorina starrii]|uniref:Uncharacterized protein n=1 Tax=Pleodorina starrii TaxID=330485 RepID=A0A9W6BFI0_9CHLO|nr:hypothetical protein PLESTM_002023400 [Pleodorina starrii]GLC50800.1 hypothetical protein PLESTB_000433300 [Pleodorina starrii]GLC74006.1 hypothetical protein PLESTF_001447300 [Pleodorina starrii]
MRELLQSGDKVMYVAQNVTDLSEEYLLGLLKKAQEDSRNREIFDHVHNICAKALEPMSYDFMNSVRSELPHRYQPLLESVNNFQDLNKLVSALRGDHGFQVALENASKPFCGKYEAELGFWKQYAALEAINTDHNKVVHCSVAASAAALSEACDKSDTLDTALAMVEALVNFGAKHAADLDASAEEQWKEGLALTQRVKQKRKNKFLRE